MGPLINRYSDTVGPIWPKIKSALTIDYLQLYAKFHENSMKRIRDIVLTDRRTDRLLHTHTQTNI